MLWPHTQRDLFTTQYDQQHHADMYSYESVFYSGSAEAIPRADTTSRGNSDAEWLLAAM